MGNETILKEDVKNSNTQKPQPKGICVQCGVKGTIYFYHGIGLCGNCWSDNGFDREEGIEEYS